MGKANIQKIPTATLDPEVISLDSTDITDLNSAPIITSENLIDDLPLADIATITSASTSDQDAIFDSYSPEETLKDTLEKLLLKIKADNNFVFQGLFVMYLEDMISKIR